jgi:hypothetical protein
MIDVDKDKLPAMSSESLNARKIQKTAQPQTKTRTETTPNEDFLFPYIKVTIIETIQLQSTIGN